MLMDHRAHHLDGHLPPDGVAGGGFASHQRHVAASAGVAIANLQRDVAAVAANGAASADRDVAARTSGLGVARGELHLAAVAGGAASAGLHGHVAAVARCATCSGRQRHRAAVGCSANTCRDRHCAAGAEPRPATISISPPVLVLVDKMLMDHQTHQP